MDGWMEGRMDRSFVRSTDTPGGARAHTHTYQYNKHSYNIVSLHICTSIFVPVYLFICFY